MSRPSRTCAFGVSSKAACYSLSACNLKTFWQPCYPKAHAPETTIAQHVKDVVSDSPGFCYGASGFCLNLPDGETVINPACWNFLWASAHKLHLAKRKSCAVAFFAPCSSWSRSKSLVPLWHHHVQGQLCHVTCAGERNPLNRARMSMIQLRRPEKKAKNM